MIGQVFDDVNVDGVSLLCGMIKQLLHHGKGCPRTLVATHFHEIIHHHLLQEDPIQWAQMEVVKVKDGRELTFLYQ